MSVILKHLTLACALAWGLFISGVPAQTAKPAPQQPLPSTTKPLDIQVKAGNKTLIDDQLAEDAATKAAIEPYAAKVRELAQPIGQLSEDMKKFGVGGGTLGNLVTDAMRRQAAVELGHPVILAVTNSSGLRKNEIKAGPLSTMDIYELLPFENALVTLDLTGEQLRRFLDIVVARRDAQAGARILYRPDAAKKNIIVTVSLENADKTGVEINPASIYTIVTIDYLVKRGGSYALLQEGKNLKPLKLTLRDTVLAYIRGETAAGRAISAARDGRFHYDNSPGAPKVPDEEP